MKNGNIIKSNAQEGNRGRKRGLKPRSQRNRKKSRGGVGLGLDQGSTEAVQIDIIPLPSISLAKEEKGESCNLNRRSRKRIRVVRPYPFTFATFSKARWLNRKILDVYHEEFGSYPRSYYESAIREGRILVSGKRVDSDYLIKGQDELTHTVHRHEPVVAICDGESVNYNDTGTCTLVPSPNLKEIQGQDSSVADVNTIKQKNQRHFPLISVIYEDDDIIVVDKPPTLPVHPSGGYNFNSLCHILSEQDPSLRGKLHNVHRLDRLTSGLTIVAKSTEVAKVLGKCVMNRDNCHKVYLARVKGKFPLNISDSMGDLKISSALFDTDVTQEDGVINASSEVKVPCVNGEWANAKYAPKIENHTPIEKEEGTQTPTPMSTLAEHKKSPKDRPKSNGAATCFWITNCKGVIEHNASLEDVFKSRADVNKLSEDGTIDGDDHENCSNDESSSTSILWLNLCVPCEIICHKNGVCKAGNPNGKPAQTAFTVLAYDPHTDSTTLLVKPQTGRTHQIRIHLEYLGHSIANDPNYGGDLFFGDPIGNELCDYARERMKEMDQNDTSKKKSDCPDNATSVDTPATEMEVENAGMHKRNDGESLLNFIERTCVWCERSRGGAKISELDVDRSVLEFLVRSPGIWLHAFQYSLVGPKGKVVHKTDLPKWCQIETDMKYALMARKKDFL